MEVTVHVLDDFFSQINGTDQFREIFAGKSKVTAIDLTQQILTCHWHVFRISSTDKIVTFVCTGTAFYADVHKYL